MKRSGIVLACAGACAILAGLSVWARGGELNPPPGPVAPTMKTLDELSAQISSIQVAAGGAPIKRVIHGMMTFPLAEREKTQSFSPSVNPAKSVVILSPAVHTGATGGTNALLARNGACLIELTADSITVAVDAHTQFIQQVSFQIVEYN